jgi:DNA-binding HxlR family transcriptional regulator
LEFSIQKDTMNRVDCPVAATLEVIGGKWKPLILFHLRERPLRFSELRSVVPQATQKMITQQLRELERDGILHQKGLRRRAAQGGLLVDRIWTNPEALAGHDV